MGQHRDEVGQRHADQGEEHHVGQQRSPDPGDAPLLQPGHQRVEQIDDDQRDQKRREDDLDRPEEIAPDAIDQDQDPDDRPGEQSPARRSGYEGIREEGPSVLVHGAPSRLLRSTRRQVTAIIGRGSPSPAERTSGYSWMRTISPVTRAG